MAIAPPLSLKFFLRPTRCGNINKPNSECCSFINPLLPFTAFPWWSFAQWGRQINNEDGMVYSNLSLEINQASDKLNVGYYYITQQAAGCAI